MSHSENDDEHVTYRQVRELADQILREAQDVADKIHQELRNEIGIVRASLATYIDERRARDIADAAAATIAESARTGNTLDYQTRTEGRLSKLEANQYVQIGLLAITIVASAVGLYRLLAGH